MDEVLKEINDKYKRPDLIMLASQAKAEAPRYGYSTGSPSLDRSLGNIAGIPAGRVTEVWGPPYSGKTTVSLETIAHLQAKDSEARCGYIDLENALDLNWAERVGVDMDRLYISWPETGEEAFGTAEALIRSGAVHIVVLDSVPAISSRAEMDGEVGDAHVGLNSRLIGQFLRKTAFAVRKSEVAVIFINQVRTKINRYGGGLENPGGFGLKHHKSVEIWLRNMGAVQLAGGDVGHRIEYTIKKNKVADPESVRATVGTFEIWADRGISYEADLVAQGIVSGVLEKRGSWIAYVDGDTIGQGLAQTVVAITDDPGLREEIERRLKNGN
jgi:recombination protein RecA